ncbi:hypothetical protein, partial [Chryseobacterium indoltheticum]|uniref:hypothetical protein n=1 Tax=Chryseobacterium indoltheticum TaxID=254 RepID=UPI003F497C59
CTSFNPFGCLTQVERSRIGVFAFIVKRFRVFRAPLRSSDDYLCYCRFYFTIYHRIKSGIRITAVSETLMKTTTEIF